MVAFMPDARAASSTMTRSPATSPCMIRLSDCSIVRIWARIASRPAGARRIRSRVSLAPGAGAAADGECAVRGEGRNAAEPATTTSAMRPTTSFALRVMSGPIDGAVVWQWSTGAAEAAPAADSSQACLVVVASLSVPRSATDLPNHARPGKLHERSVAGDLELTVRIGLAKVPHRAVIHEVGAVIGTELEIHRTVDSVNPTHEGLLERAVVGEPLELELKRILEVDELDVVTLFRVAVGGREPEVALAPGKGSAAPDRSMDERIRHEVDPDNCHVRWLERQSRRDRLGRERQDVANGHVSGGDCRAAGGSVEDRHGRRIAEVVSRSASRIEHRLGGIQEAEPIWPAVVIGAAIGILLGEMQPIRGVLGRPRTPLVFAVLGHEQPAPQRMIVRRKPNAVRVPVSPREGFDRVLRVLCVMIRSQDGAVADARPGRALEGRHGRSRTSHAERRIPARLDTTARVEHVVAELDVLTRNILLVGATTVVATHNPGVGRRSLGPVDPVAFEGDLLCRVVPRGKAGDERGNAPGVGIDGHDA